MEDRLCQINIVETKTNKFNLYLSTTMVTRAITDCRGYTLKLKSVHTLILYNIIILTIF